MKRFEALARLVTFGMVAGSMAGPANPQVPTFEFGFRGCADLTGEPGAAVSGEVVCTLRTSNNPDPTTGAAGWMLSVAAEGAVSITAISVTGTAAALNTAGGLRDPTGSFEVSRITADGPFPDSCPGGLNGAVSLVVLSFSAPITLPGTDNTQDIARLTLSGTAPATEPACRPARLFYIDGCRILEDGPAHNLLTWMGGTVLPSLGECSFNVCAIEAPFTRADCNADGARDIADAVFLLDFLFRAPAPLPCLDACDVDDDGAVDIGDPLKVLFVLFGEAEPIPSPASCAADPTVDDLDCSSFPPCS